ncbi:ATP-binding protein [cf. Phormidesmis sp. LEGE 11477]|uniref:ATP-binding protein n=1 Tax=cf. Phormidesmis sp. LEGE 11477 TaxID=1828680 RepID=UPI00187F6A02|nr:ATP-binding protein [cf. Phormidesmis sp. LEGE 11477]MBE9059908.1 AAA family ATPase [cf. Phormidesmis sp. LEGE 11477]
MVTRTVFVGGVHGVGKTYFCKNIICRFDAAHVTASELIGRHVKHQIDKTVSNVEKNQLILAEELARYQTSCRTILLDGHFCLLNSTSNIQDVPLETFKAISLCAIVLLIDNPEAIAERLSSRDSRTHSIELISELQSREITRAELVSQSLKIPISIINAAEDIEKLIKKIDSYL